MKNFRSAFLIFGFLFVISGQFNRMVAQDTLEVMYYNILNYPGSTPERVDHFRTINQYINADVILVNEILNDEGANFLLQDGLNVYGTTKFQKADFINGYDTDNALFYNSDKLVLHSQDTIETALRLINEYVLYYNSYDLSETQDTIFLYFYSVHLKASSGSTNAQKRLAEVLEYKDHIDNKPNAKNIFFGGDFNVYTSSEPAYQSLINDGLYPLNDPLPAANWHNNDLYSMIHSQSTRTSQFGGGATGGMDDRFDFILFSNDVLNGNNGVKYINNSCYALGNDGNHFNMSLIDAPVNTSVPDSVLQALYYMSDHLPVICNIEVQSSIVPSEYFLDLKVFLEGPFDGNEMNTDLTGLTNFPLVQPYNQPPWNYFGDESVTSIQNPDIVDWVLVELRETSGDASSAIPDSTILKEACFLLKDGIIVSQDQINIPIFDLPVSNDLYIIVRHRNHLDIMTSVPVVVNNGHYSFDFSLDQYQVYGFEAGYKEIITNVWGMVSADGNTDGIVNFEDKSIWGTQSGKQGYLIGDFNLNGQVDNFDKNENWLKNLDFEYQVPD